MWQCIFIDFAKVFDTGSHEILPQILAHIGIRGICLQLIKSYLLLRKQSVAVADDVSNESPVEYEDASNYLLGSYFI